MREYGSRSEETEVMGARTLEEEEGSDEEKGEEENPYALHRHGHSGDALCQSIFSGEGESSDSDLVTMTPTYIVGEERKQCGQNKHMNKNYFNTLIFSSTLRKTKFSKNVKLKLLNII